MDEKTFDSAIEKFDKALQDFRGKQDERLDEATERTDELEARLNSVEANLSTGGTLNVSSEGMSGVQYKRIDTFVRSGRGLEKLEGKALTTGDPSQDALLPKDGGDMIFKMAWDASPMMQIVRNVSTDTQNFSRVLRTTPGAMAWIGEAGSRAITADAAYRIRTPSHGEFYSRPEHSNHLVADTNFDIVNETFDDVARETGRQLADVIVNGNGTNRPTGIYNTAPVTTSDFASPLRDADAIQYVAAPSPNILTDHLIDAFFSLDPGYRANATWVMSSATLAACRKAKTSQGDYLWQPLQGAEGDGVLLGRPVVTNESLPAIGQSPLLFPILIGDFQQGYMLVRIGQTRVIRDEVTNPGYLRLYFFQRYGGCILNNDAIKGLQL